MFKKLLLRTTGLFYVHGFYRGFISHPKYMSKEEIENNLLIIDRINQGLFTGITNTLFFPITIYNFCGRLEIAISNRNPYKFEWLYDEGLICTTLKPKN
jgi:hypothetical protein